MSAVFPSSVATALQLLTAINNTKVTLAVDAGIGDTTLTVDDASPLPASGYLTFDDDESNPETIYYVGISGNNLTGVTRAADSTSAGIHSAGVHLEQRWNAAYHNMTVTEIIAVEQYLSDRFGIASSPIVPSGKTLTLAATSNQLVLGTTNTTTISSTAPASSRTYTIPDAGGNVQFVMAGGTQTIAGAKTFSSAVAITATSNQLIFGVTNTTTVSFTAPASSAVYTIPDVGTTANFVMSAGTQTIGGAKTFSSAVTINPTTNQIVLGVTNTVTISSTAPASSRTYTIPDAGGAASFVMTAGTQTIAGATTISLLTATLAANMAAGGFKITGLANGSVSTDSAAFGQIPTVSAVIAFAPTWVAFGTVSLNTGFYIQIGKILIVWGSVRTGTTAASVCSVTIPTGALDLASLSASTSGKVGTCREVNNPSNAVQDIFSDGSDTTHLFISAAGTAGSGYTKANGASEFDSTVVVTYNYIIPIA